MTNFSPAIELTNHVAKGYDYCAFFATSIAHFLLVQQGSCDHLCGWCDRCINKKLRRDLQDGRVLDILVV